MGGCTITEVGDSIDEILANMKIQVCSAIRAGLWPDSELIVLNPETQEAIIYTIEYTYSKDGRDPLPHSVKFKETPKGRCFHVGVAATYGPKPEPGQYVGTFHAHT